MPQTDPGERGEPVPGPLPAPGFDVVIASDLRFQGGTSHSIAEEVRAQHRAGYRTALIHLNGPLLQRLRPVNPELRRAVERGHAELLVGQAPVRTRLLVLRHPAVAEHALDQLPPVRAEQVVVVANAGPHDIDGRRHYSPAAVDAVVRRHCGQDPTWAPIGPQVRAAIVAEIAPERLLDPDWVNVIDVDAWASPRRTGAPGSDVGGTGPDEGGSDVGGAGPGAAGTGPDGDGTQPGPGAGRRPVVGRHSRASPQKWPADAATLRAVYPTDGRWDVRVLGGADPVVAVLGEQPAAWQVQPFGAVAPREFLAGLDFFVYYHDPRWVEAFGRTVLEALASGAVAVLPPHFEPLFGPAARYAEPAAVRELVETLHADPVAYRAQVGRATALVRARFGHEAHLDRLHRLIGPAASAPSSHSAPPTGGAETQQVGRSRIEGDRAEGDGRRVLLISSNGSGVGHLTRLLAYARRLGEDVEPCFLSLSQAVPVVGRFGYRYEYLPSHGSLAMAPSAWQEMFVTRVQECLQRVRPELVVFDGTYPYRGIPAVRRAWPGLPWVWSRRGMWRKGHSAEQVGRGDWFDAVLEPGDLAAAYDQGATASAPAARVGPVTLLDPDDRQPREQARRELGLDPDQPQGLISLGAGTINDITTDVAEVAAAMRSLGLGVCLTRTEIGQALGRDDVRVVREYPLARRYGAFDVVVSAAGYNSFAELMRMGMPSLLVPNTATALDDQAARARFAGDQGWAHVLPRVEAGAVRERLADLLQRGPEMVAGAVRADPGNGAPEAARVLRQVMSDRSRVSHAPVGQASTDQPQAGRPTVGTP